MSRSINKCLVHVIWTVSNVEIGVKYLLLLSFLTAAKFYNLGHIQGTYYYMGALTQKRSFVVICTTFRSDFHSGWKNQNKHSTLNSSFDSMSKWHDFHNNAFLLQSKQESTTWSEPASEQSGFVDASLEAPKSSREFSLSTSYFQLFSRKLRKVPSQLFCCL